MFIKRSFIIALSFLLGNSIFAQTILPQDSIIGVVVEKEGPLSAVIGHNHFIFAPDFNYSFQSSTIENKLAIESISIDFEVKELVNDLFDTSQEWQSKLQAYGLLDGELTEINEDDRKEIKKSMLSKSQLDGEEFPIIAGDLILDPNNSSLGKLFLEIKGVKQERQVNIKWIKDEITKVQRIEFFTSFNFNDFGITPYQALGGGLKNKDRFSLLISLLIAE